MRTVRATILWLTALLGASLLQIEVATAKDSTMHAVLAPIVDMVAAANQGQPLPPQLFTSDAVIVDEFPPFKWEGEGAQNRWYGDFGKVMKKMSMTNPHIILAKAQFFEVVGNRAYVVIPSTFSYTAKDKPQTERGAFTFTLAQSGDRWQISSEIWAKTYDSAVVGGTSE